MAWGLEADHVHPFIDTRETRLTDYLRLNAYVRYPAWSPRDDQIVFEYAETTGNVWLLEGLR